MEEKLVKYIIFRLLFLTGTLFVMAYLAANVWADDYAGAMLGMFNNGRPSPANVKFGQVGHREDIEFGFFNQYEGGGWVQVQEGDGRKSSAYVADQIGLEVENGAVVRIAAGPALITDPDSYLGGNFQFTEDLFIGLKGSYHNTIGFKYKHFSSAGLEMPNQGRDFGGIEVDLHF